MKLYRKTNKSFIGGICLGISDKYHVDCFLVRLITLFLFFLIKGVIIFVYIFLWNILPSSDSNSTIKEELINKFKHIYIDKKKLNKNIFIGSIIIFVAMIYFLIFFLPSLKLIIIIGFSEIGIYWLYNKYIKNDRNK